MRHLKCFIFSVSGLEVNVQKTDYMVMFRKQRAEQNNSMRISNKFSERAGQFKYFGTTLTNKNSINEEIKTSVKSGNACYHSVQNFLHSSQLPKNIKIKV